MVYNYAQFDPQGSQLGPNVGPNLASAATIVPTHMCHSVTGAVAIVNITPPDPGFSGFLVLHAAAGSAWTWTAAGNISLVSTAAQTVNSAALFFYNPFISKWIPIIDNA